MRIIGDINRLAYFVPKDTTCVIYLDEIDVLGVDWDDFQSIDATSQ